jgi:hypothetical protein
MPFKSSSYDMQQSPAVRRLTLSSYQHETYDFTVDFPPEQGTIDTIRSVIADVTDARPYQLHAPLEQPVTPHHRRMGMIDTLPVGGDSTIGVRAVTKDQADRILDGLEETGLVSPKDAERAREALANLVLGTYQGGAELGPR